MMPENCWFITATDTNAGKTFVAAGLAAAFIKLKLSVGVMKPVETGCMVKSGLPVPSDATLLKAASGSDDSIGLINPYSFIQPLSPSIASALSTKKIEFKKIKAAFEKIRSSHDVTLVEGAGGILSPISRDRTNADLAKYLGLPVIIVVPSRLGAINQALLAINAAKAKGLKIAVVILNNRKNRGSKNTSQKYNKTEIERFGRIKVMEIS